MPPESHQNLRINPRRLRNNFEALAEIGSTGDGGVHRPVFHEAHLAARRWYRHLATGEGFEVRVDPAGNHSAFYPCSYPAAPSLLLGSHLDSVPSGGRFDGALGVVAAFEVLQTIREAGLTLPFHLEAIDFTDEEGTLLGMLGSRAVAGILPQDEILEPRGGYEQLTAALSAASLKPSQLLDAYREPETLAGFLELHIEQGPRLTEASVDIGVVQSLVGIGTLRVIFHGRADHAGTTPFAARQDAGLGAATFTLAARQIVLEAYPNCVMNVGRISLRPGVENIVPAEAELRVEYRSPDPDQMARLAEQLEKVASEAAEQWGLTLVWEDLGAIQPAACDRKIRSAFFEASRRLDLKAVELHSGGGHDTMAMAAICPAGMIFVPSTGGSHSPREFARWEDCVNGANVLLQAVLVLAARAEGLQEQT